MFKRQRGFTLTSYFLFVNNSKTKKGFLNNRLLIGKRKMWGFTLFEMLVVIAVISIITILVLVYFRPGEQQYKLSQSAQQMLVYLRQVQNRALSGADPGEDISGYGVYVENEGTYSIFYNPKSETSNKYVGSSKIIETIKLYQSITISNVELDGDSSGGINKSIFFVPPQPLAFIDGRDPDNQAESSKSEIIITLTGTGGATSKISATEYGRIEIK